MTTVFLLRHGALGGESRNRFIGHTDLPLSPEGVQQAEHLGWALRGRFGRHRGARAGGLVPRLFDAVYCSDLLRSRQTAERVVGMVNGAARNAIEARGDLREIALGEWEDLSRAEVATRFPAQYAARGEDIANYRIPGGESFADCRERIVAAWREIVGRGGERIVIVGHAGANRALLCHLQGKPLAELFELGQDYGCINIIETGAEGVRVRLINGRPDDLDAALSASQSVLHSKP